MLNVILLTAQPQAPNLDDQVICQALMLRLLEDARYFIRRTSGGTPAHKAALRMFDDLVALNGQLAIGDEALAPAHSLKAQWNETNNFQIPQ